MKTGVSYFKMNAILRWSCLLCFLLSADGKRAEAYPQRSNDDAALLEWGHSAIIHAADAVVAEFGLQASEEEFELGIEAAPVVGKPPQGCEPFRNADAVHSQVSRCGRRGVHKGKHHDPRLTQNFPLCDLPPKTAAAVHPRRWYSFFEGPVILLQRRSMRWQPVRLRL